MTDFWIFEDHIISQGLEEGGYALKIYKQVPSSSKYSYITVSGDRYYIVRYDFKDSLSFKGVIKDKSSILKFFKEAYGEFEEFFNSIPINPLNHSEILLIFEKITRIRIVTYDQSLTFFENVPFSLKRAKPSGLIFEGKTYLYLKCEFLEDASKIPAKYDNLYDPVEQTAIIAIPGHDLEDAVEKCHVLKIELFKKRVKIFSPATPVSNRRLFSQLMPGASK